MIKKPKGGDENFRTNIGYYLVGGICCRGSFLFNTLSFAIGSRVLDVYFRNDGFGNAVSEEDYGSHIGLCHRIYHGLYGLGLVCIADWAIDESIPTSI